MKKTKKRKKQLRDVKMCLIQKIAKKENCKVQLI